VFHRKFITSLARELAPAVVDAIKPHLGGGIAPRYLNMDQAAQYLSSTPDGVRGMLRAKHFPARKIGTRVMIDRNDIDKAMNENVHWLE
jgi:excisionase family DNA binding protein